MFLIFSIYFVSCLKFLLKIHSNSLTFIEIPENFQGISGKFLDLQPFRESHWCSKLEFQVLLAINLEFLGICRFLEPELLQLAIPQNSQEVPVRIYRENSHLLFLGTPGVLWSSYMQEKIRRNSWEFQNPFRKGYDVDCRIIEFLISHYLPDSLLCSSNFLTMLVSNFWITSLMKAFSLSSILSTVVSKLASRDLIA